MKTALSAEQRNISTDTGPCLFSVYTRDSVKLSTETEQQRQRKEAKRKQRFFLRRAPMVLVDVFLHSIVSIPRDRERIKRYINYEFMLLSQIARKIRFNCINKHQLSLTRTRCALPQLQSRYKCEFQ